MRKQLLIGLPIVVLLIVVGIAYAVLPTTNQSLHIHQGVASHSGAIEGRVLDANGQVVSEAEVHVLKSDFTSGKIPTVYTDKEGKFLIKGLASGIYTISVGKEEEGYVHMSSPFFSAGLITAPQVNVNEHQTTTDVVVHLGPKAAKLIGRVVDVSTNRPVNNLQNVQITLRRVDYPDYSYSTGLGLDSEFNILVPSVPVMIEVSASGYEKKHLSPLQLKQGEVKRLDISLRAVR
jgi:Carboxypeptidase regulatory-like domain